jgi:hypothetical protein
MREYISKSTIIKYRDNGLTEKSIQIYPDKNKCTTTDEDSVIRTNYTPVDLI